MKILAAALSMLLPLAAQAAEPSSGGHSAGTSSVSSGVGNQTGAPQRPAPPVQTAPGPHSSTGNSTAPIYYNNSAYYFPGLISFPTLQTYLFWRDYYGYLTDCYALSPFYFDRFYYNVEPLITPDVLRLTLRDPVRMSAEMLEEIDQLESMYRDAQSGKPINKALFVATSQQIRDFAKRIRGERVLSIYDLRKGKDMYGSGNGPVTAEDFRKLREMALDLNRQLKSLYTATSTSTISVDSYKEPSMESLARGIEKVCRSIEDSAKRM